MAYRDCSQEKIRYLLEFVSEDIWKVGEGGRAERPPKSDAGKRDHGIEKLNLGWA